MPDTGTADDAALSPRRAQTRERLLAAARSVFAARGIYGASVEDICDAASFSRGAFYSNFGSKEDLFFALLEREEAERMRRLHLVLSQKLPAGTDLVDELVRRILDTQPIDRQWFLIHSEFALHALRSPEAAKRLSESWNAFCGQLNEFLEAGLALAGLRLVVDPLDAVAALIAVYESAVRDMLIDNPDATEAAGPQLAQQMMPVMIRAFSEPIPPQGA